MGAPGNGKMLQPLKVAGSRPSLLKAACYLSVCWSGRPGSNGDIQLGKLAFYH